MVGSSVTLPNLIAQFIWPNIILSLTTVTFFQDRLTKNSPLNLTLALYLLPVD